MASESAAETKKAVCRSFTKVVKASRLGDSIDPKAFFMMLNTNFGVLYRDGQIDLGPLWQALVASHPPESLYAVFLKFGESAEQVGLIAILPDAVNALSADQRAAEMQGMTADGLPLGIVTGDSGSYPSIEALPILDDSGAIEQLPLSTGDLKPFIPDETKRQITQHVVHAVKVAPVGQKVDAHQLAFLVDSNFEDLFNGYQFDFNPVLDGLRNLADFQDADVYVAVLRLEQKLHAMGLVLSPVSLQVDPAVAQQLIDDAERRERQAAQEAANAVAQTRVNRVTQVPEVGAPVPDDEKSDSAKATRKAQSLAKWSISSKKLTTRAKALRYSVLSAMAVAMAIGAYVTWPNRPIAVTPYATTIPLVEARLESGSLQGILDDSVWWKLDPDARGARIAAFEKLVYLQGQQRYLQIRDSENRLVIGIGPDGRLRPANFFRYGNQDGSISDEQRVRMLENLPAGVKKTIETHASDKTKTN